MSDITVLSRTQRIVVDPFSSSIAIINAGPQGPVGLGDPGPPGIQGPPGEVTQAQLDTVNNALDARLDLLEAAQPVPFTYNTDWVDHVEPLGVTTIRKSGGLVIVNLYTRTTIARPALVAIGNITNVNDRPTTVINGLALAGTVGLARIDITNTGDIRWIPFGSVTTLPAGIIIMGSVAYSR